MPPTESKAAVRPDQLELKIDGTKAPFFVSVDYDLGYVLTDLKPASVGVVIERYVTGYRFEATINCEQTSEAEVRQFLETVPGAGATQHGSLAIGAQIPKHTLNLHSPFSSDSASDINIGAATFGSLKQTVDGDGLATIGIPVSGLMPASGPFFSVKAPA